jgi:hypothetical protein
VDPGAIAQTNGLQGALVVYPGQVLRIPKVQWVNIVIGPVCAPQFVSPFPGLPVPTATSAAPLPTATPSGPPLVLEIHIDCVDNCNSSEGNYVLRFNLSASGGIQPYTFDPVPPFDVTVPHCTTGTDLVSVRSADGQFVQETWSYHDPSCPSP